MRSKATQEFVIISRRRPWQRTRIKGESGPTLAFLTAPPPAPPIPPVPRQTVEIITEPTPVPAPPTSTTSSLQKAIEEIPRAAAGIGTVIACIVAAVAGFSLGRYLGDWMADQKPTVFGVPLGVTSATLSAAVFITLAEKLMTTVQSVLGQFAKPDRRAAAFDILKVFLAFAVFMFSVAVIREEVKPPEVELEPSLLLQLPDRAPVAILPVLFAKNAKLTDAAEKIDNVAGSPGDIWQEGTRLADIRPSLVSNFMANLRRCAEHATAEEPIVLSVRGFASSLEFMDSTDKKKVRPDSDALNLRASNDRAATLFAAINAEREKQSGPWVVRPLQPYQGLDEMVRDRVYLDRVLGERVEQNEDLTRRAEIVVIQAPGCAGPAALTG